MNLVARLQDALKSVVRRIRKFAYASPVAMRDRAFAGKQLRVGLALGGGFARGLAHIGVLKVLVEIGIPIDAIAGTSVGAIIAAAFASGLTPGEMVEEARKVRWKEFARWTVPRIGLATNEKMEAMLRRVLPYSRFEEMNIPLAVVATDLVTGQAVVFRQGDAIAPLRASCSFPGLFNPVEYEGRLLVDGAIVGSVPTLPLRDFVVDKIIAVYLKTDYSHQPPTNIFQVIGQSFQIAQSLNEATWKDHCDLVIEPEVGEFKWDEFERADDLILEGERAAKKALPLLRTLLKLPGHRQVPEVVAAR